MNQHEFVSQCRNSYISKGFLPGDSEHGPWENAHYPAPRSKNGSKTVLLLRHHHQVQGVLQSEEFGIKCFYSSHFNSCLDQIIEEFPAEFVKLVLDLKAKWEKHAAETNFKEFRKANGQRSNQNKSGRYENGTKRSKQWRQKGAASTNSVKWISTIDGYVSTAAGVALHNKSKGWDPTAKKKVHSDQ